MWVGPLSWGGRAAVLLALLAPLLAACAVPPGDSRPVALASRDFGFIDELGQAGAGRAREVDGRLFLPPTGAAPYPAVVLLHSSIGQGTQDWRTADVLRARGFAVLAIDSFGPRGVEKTIKDQTLVSEASMVADAYAGLAALSADPRIDGGRIAVMGFSKGGIAALYAGLETVRARMGVGARRFAAHVAYYPWCGVAFLDPRTTGAPILIELGARDEVAPPALCEAFAGEVRKADPAGLVRESAGRRRGPGRLPLSRGRAGPLYRDPQQRAGEREKPEGVDRGLRS